MNEIELEFADYCIDLLFKEYPKGEALSMRFNGIDDRGASIVIEILKAENLIERVGVRTKLTSNGYSIINEHKSYSNYIKHRNNSIETVTRNEGLDAKLKELQIESFEYQKTIRERDEEIATLSKENIKIQTKLNKWQIFGFKWWLSGAIISVLTFVLSHLKEARIILNHIWQLVSKQ